MGSEMCIRDSSWTDNNGQKHVSTDVQVEEVEFLESKSSSESYQAENMSTSGQNNMIDNSQNMQQNEDFYSIEQDVDDDNLPF